MRPESFPALVIFDSHPVQYKAPVYQELERLRPGRFKVLYYSDCSVRGHFDPQFGRNVSWDTPLLSGYNNDVLNNERGVPLSGFLSLHGKGIFKRLARSRPRAVMLSQLLYSADMRVWIACRALQIPLWMRVETQDAAFRRSSLKSAVRSALYRLLYKGFRGAFYIGECNRKHLAKHGFDESQLRFSPYCVPSSLDEWPLSRKQKERDVARRELGVPPGATVVLFCGKLIPKKNPGLLIEAAGCMTSEERARFFFIFVGTGELEEELRYAAVAQGVPGCFVGFVNQSRLSRYYLAADIVGLPSRQMGETWGLVVNEGLHAGCSVVMTDVVGACAEFGTWDRVRVIGDGDARGCAKALQELAGFRRSFDWCLSGIGKYATTEAAAAIVSLIDEL